MKTHFSKKPALFFSLLLILSSLASPAGATESPVPPRAAGDPLETSRFGLNPGIGALDWDPAEMFADVMKTFREVTAPDGVTPVARDAQGWPLADCRFLVWAGLTRPIETYHLKFTGSAASIVGTGATVSNIQYNAGTNTTTADVLLDGSDALYLAFTGTAGGVKNVQLMMPGHNFGETWNHAFLSALAPVKVIRLMDFTATNWNQEVNWSERTQPDAATQQSTGPGYGWQGKGIAWEYAIDLLNATNKDGWINIPAEVTDAYVASLIDLIQNGGNGFAPLETERKLYIEYSNELWNGMFDQAQFNHEQAVLEVNAGGSPLNFDGETNEWYWAWRRVGKRIVEISDQFRAAFGNEQMMTRFRPVLAWQYDAGQATAPQQLDFIQKYYGTNQWGFADPHPVNYYLWCGGGALYYHKKPVAEDPDWQNAVITDSKYASAFGIHFCNYEGAMYFDSDTDPDWDASWVTQRMIDRQQFYEEHGGSLFMFFTLAATWENGLGHVRTIRNLDTPKYNGILQLSQQAQAWQNTYGATLPMNTDGGQFSLIEGDWESPHAGATAISPNAWRAYHFDADTPGIYKVWIEYSSTADINLKIYASSELLATLTGNTNGTTTTSPHYLFNSVPGLKAIRIENHGAAEFNLVRVHVVLEQATAVNRIYLPLILQEYTIIPIPPGAVDIPNPERGFYQWVDFNAQSLDEYAASGYTLAYTTAGKLNAYRDRDLPPEYLNALSAHFQLAREAGIKLIVRFSYNDGPSAPNTEPDATLAQVLQHIEQVAPLLQANKDVIAWFEAGFIGAWGEWHSSTNGLDSDVNKAIIRDALFANFPQDRFILFRYPGDFIGWYPQALTETQAFSGTDQARAGHHNDCFLSNEHDAGTYLDQDGNLKISEWQAYIAQMTRFVPMNGETCQPNPPRSNCETALQEMEMLHWTAQNEAWHPDVIQGWKEQGCYDEIRNRLGYRLTLLQAQYPAQVRAGETLSLQITLENTGFASPLLPRPVYLVLAGQQTTQTFPLSVDPRRWEPGRHTIDVVLTLPTNLPADEYNLALWLPDPSPTLQQDPRYALRFANENIWDAEHGWNLISAASNTIFADVPSTHWAWSWIETLYNSGITGGCGVSPLIYCPDSSVTRAQMAVFLLRGIHGSAYTPPTPTGSIFTDVPLSYWASAWIEQLYAEGITGGCGVGLYCPDEPVTRAQMAVFLLRAEHGSAYAPPVIATTQFTDVPTSYWAAAWVEQLAVEGITGGCGVGLYCPDDPVTRAQMAVFLVKTFNLP